MNIYINFPLVFPTRTTLAQENAAQPPGTYYARFLEYRSFQSILGLLRADQCMSALAGKYQGTEKGGRSLLAKVCKLQDDLDVISLTMDRQVAERGVHIPLPKSLSLGKDPSMCFYPGGETGTGIKARFCGVNVFAFKAPRVSRNLTAVYIFGLLQPVLGT